jgi:hypothetical protein
MLCRVLALTAASIMIGCAGGGPPKVQPRALPDEPVHLPVATPFDDDPAFRAVYLNYYWFGYSEATRGVGATFCDNGHPWYEVQQRGYSDGQTAGRDQWIRKQMTPADRGSLPAPAGP